MRTPRLVACAGVALLSALAILSSPRTAAGDADDPGDVPTGTVAFFARPDGTCPPGWAVATYARGRLVAGVVDGPAVGRQVGEPLGDQEDRAHRHAFQADVEIPAKAIAAADGGNRQGAQAQKYFATGETDAVTSGLPFIQIVACERP